MTRFQRALTSLVAVVPAGYLGYLLVMALLNQSDAIGGTIFFLVIGVLVAAVVTVLIPFGILVFGGPKAPPVEKPAKKAAASDEEVEAVSDEVEEASAIDDTDFVEDDADADVFADDVEIEDEDEPVAKKKKKKK